jgi:esterase/lipase
VRTAALCAVIANEIEPLSQVTEAIRGVARAPGFLVSRRVRDVFFEEDQALFEEDYARFYDPALSKGPEVGRPFLLRPLRIRGGVVLSHGYLAAPLEVRATAEYLCRHGYAVYGVRLRGHGTSPEDVAERQWADWYESFNRGYAIIRSLTPNIFLGGFSMGGCVALIAAARKKLHARGAFAICTPLQVRNYSIRLAPSIVTLNALLKRLNQNRTGWEYVENYPENRHINYSRNPLTGVKELVALMDAMDDALPDVRIPTLVVQGSKDPTVNPVSGQLIFDRLGTAHKELVVLERERHGIINGAGSEEVHARVLYFLQHTSRLAEEPGVSSSAAAG